MEAAQAAKVEFDPSLIPTEAVDHLAAETIRLVRWMKSIPKYREEMDQLTAARRLNQNGGQHEGK